MNIISFTAAAETVSLKFAAFLSAIIDWCFEVDFEVLIRLLAEQAG
jgi:hypothetical protein